MLDAVVSVMLVEGCSSAEALSHVLQLRHAALMAAIAARPSATAKAQISQFTTLFVASLSIIYAVFIGKYWCNNDIAVPKISTAGRNVLLRRVLYTFFFLVM